MTTDAAPDALSDDAWMISVDDHVIEPRTVWADRLPAKYLDVGPRWVSDEQGEAWRFEDARVPVGGAVTSGAIWPPERRPPNFYPLAFSQIPPVCYDPTARIEAMDTDHVLASMVFPNLPGFAGGFFVRARDKELARLCIQAYNDWVLEEWCEAAPGRFIGLALIPMWDGALAAAEAERVIGKGARAISFSMAPHNLGLPSIHDEHGSWDPLLAVANETGVPLCTHLGTGTGTRGAGGDGLAAMTSGSTPGAPAAISAVMQLLEGQGTLLDWIYSGHFQRYPNLKLCLSENGIGWIPAVLQAADWLVKMTRERITQPADPENDPLLTEEARVIARAALDERALRAKDAPMPSDLFREHVYGCFIDDPVGLKLVDDIGIDNVMIETDFPHNASWYPFSMEKAWKSVAHLTSEDRRKVLRGNAERLFHFTPAAVPAPAV